MAYANAVTKRGFTRLVLCILFSILLITVSSSVARAAVPDKIKIGVVASVGRAPYKDAGIVKFSAQGNYKVIDLSALPGMDVLGEVKDGDNWQVAYLTTGIQVINNGNPVKITQGPVVVQEVYHEDGNLVTLKSYVPNGNTGDISINKKYRGNMEFKLGAGHLVGINELPLEEYLYGVVPREMSNGWPIEALKAQALAARTYAVNNYNKRLIEGFNLLDTVDDQAYGGYNYEGSQATQAVNETAGELILYENKLISALYHSNSGGHTENSENVWSSAVPYLVGKPDPYSLECRFGNWNYDTVSMGTDSMGRIGIQDKLQELDPNFGILAGFEVEEYPSGRVKKILIKDTTGYTIEKTGLEFGKIFNPGFYKFLNEESFMSNLFDIVTDNYMPVKDVSGEVVTLEGGPSLKVINSDGIISAINNSSAEFYVTDGEKVDRLNNLPTKISFVGHGWGHGVGMSQWGAYQMAKEGKTYQEILTFYYTGVTISKDYAMNNK